MRYIALLSFFILSIAPAHAGFEWIPPKESGVRLGEEITNQKRDEALAPDWQDNMRPRTINSSAESIPLADNGPTSLFPSSPQERMQQQRIAAMPKTNLSGKKLFIDPYPLRTGQALAPMQGSGASVALQEEAKNLHPVNLGGGFSTGVKPKTIPFPKPSQSTSESYKPRMPPINTGITPMMDSAPLPVARPATKTIRLNPTPLAQKYAQAIGFGQDLPLDLALSQIIPIKFTHGFAKNVDTDIFVSWEGGKAWNLVLNEMLRPNNLTAIIEGNQVTIQPMASL